MAESSLDLDEFAAVLTNLGNVAERLNTMGTAISQFGAGSHFPAGVDLSGLDTALRALSNIATSTQQQQKSLIDTLKAATKADKSWGDHFKSWLTPPKTGIGILDNVLSEPASATAGAVDAGHDFGAGLAGLTWDFVDVYGDVQDYRHGRIMPIQKPGLGMINMVVHPENAAKAAVGWQYHNDPTRMGTYAGLNILAIVATGSIGEAGEAALTARLARLEAATEESASLASKIDRLEEDQRNQPSGRQRNPAKRRWAIQQRASIAKDLERSRGRLAELSPELTAQQAARIRALLKPLSAVRNQPIIKAIAAIPTMGVAQIIHRVFVGSGEASAVISIIWSGFEDGSGLGSAGADAKEIASNRARLREIAAAHPGSQ
jgi:hypothetical protein